MRISKSNTGMPCRLRKWFFFERTSITSNDLFSEGVKVRLSSRLVIQYSFRLSTLILSALKPIKHAKVVSLIAKISSNLICPSSISFRLTNLHHGCVKQYLNNSSPFLCHVHIPLSFAATSDVGHQELPSLLRQNPH